MRLAGLPEECLYIGRPAPTRDFVLAIDPEAAKYSEAEWLLAGALAVHTVVDRPTPADAEAIDALVSLTGATRVVSLGAGLVIDAVKLCVHTRHARVGTVLRHVTVPCGPEPYRAVTPFTMYDAVPGARGVEWEDWLIPAEVAIVPELLARLDPSVVALFAGDSAVHAVESLLSTRSNPESEPHAIAAAQAFVEEGASDEPNRVRLVVASLEAALAFDTTKLGLAHALSRPLGIATGISHDGYNLALGAPMVRFWGDEVIRRSSLARVPSSTPSAEWWACLLDGYRARAGLPANLKEAGLDDSAVAAAIEWAPNSSGIPGLPRPLAAGDLESLMELA
jgi:hypothetical protein